MPRVRCLPPSSTLPSRTSMMGLIESTEASSALAPPIRPPFFRFSRVSRAPQTLLRDGHVAGGRRDLVERRAVGGQPGGGDGDHALAEGDRAGVDHPHRQSRRPRRWRRVGRSASSPRAQPDRATTTMPVAPSAAQPAVRRLEQPGRRCRGLGQDRRAAQRRQNSSGVRSRRSTNSSSPKRMVSGTISIPSSRAVSSGRSQALSVTMRMVTSAEATRPRHRRRDGPAESRAPAAAAACQPTAMQAVLDPPGRPAPARAPR